MNAVVEPNPKLVELAKSPDLKPLQQIHQERTGRKLAPQVLNRWVHKGVGGVTILAVKRGRQWHTTSDEYARFEAAKSQVMLDRCAGSRNVTVGELRAAGLL